SQGAENALLKTLEEPPPHVVFVLATTDPQKVRPTIRSRTQHFEFRLLPPDVLADHVRHVIADAGLDLDEATVERAVEHVVRSGGGSARDTLSALDQVAALGDVVDEVQPVDAVLDALCARDPGAVLVAVADALASGRDPRTLGENLVSALRDAFLAVMGAADRHLPPAARNRAERVGEALGAPGLTRALEVLGEALTELARKPDPRIVLEVALVRLTQPSADRSLDALLERVDRLERALAGGAAPPPAPGGDTGPGATPAARTAPAAGPGVAAAGAGEPATPSARSGRSAGGRPGGGGAAAARDALSSARAARSAGGDPPAPAATGGGRPTLGAIARGRRGAARGGGATTGSPAAATTAGPADAGGATGAAGDPADRPASAAVATDAPADGPGTPVATPGPDAGGDAPSPPTRDEIEAAWAGGVLAGLPLRIRSKWRGGRWIDPAGGVARFAVPNEWHLKACDGFRHAVEEALTGHFGRPVRVALVVEADAGRSGGGAAAGADPFAPPAGPGPDDGDEDIDPSELQDADDVPTSGVDIVLEEFGGGEVIALEEEP
ncbi:MAG TPA: hypothetical protein VKZ72_01600, partial [Acidimicrobiales bacterium]|nr:hypothetical protein [Acidimicrobiales bacterium]